MKIKHLSLTLLFIVCALELNAQTIQEKIAECEKQWDPAVLRRANTAKDADYLSEISKQCYYFCNLARFDGPLFAKTFMETFCSDWHTNTSDNFKTLKEDLAKSVGLFPLLPDKGLATAAQSHAEDDKKNAHTSGDGTGCTQRLVVKFGCKNYGAENVAWGRYENGIQPVIQWLIDNGNAPSYGHRRHILGPGYTKMGVGLYCNPTDGGCCMVQDFGRYNDEDVLDFIYKNFPEKVIKIADVARNVDYMNEKEKDILMIANIARLDLKRFNQKVMMEFNPEPDTAIIHYIESKYDVKMTLLYPDRKVLNKSYAAVNQEDYVPFEPLLDDTQEIKWNWSQYFGWNCTFWTILFSKALYDEVNYCVGYKFAYSPTKGYRFAQTVSHGKSDEGWDYAYTSDLYTPSNNDKPNPDAFITTDEEESVLPPLITPITNGPVTQDDNDDKPSFLLIDAQTDDGSETDPGYDVEYEDEDDNYYDDDDEDDDDDDGNHHHHPGYHHHPSYHHQPGGHHPGSHHHYHRY